MSARVLRRISLRRASILVFIAVAVLTALFMVKMTQGEAAAPTQNPNYTKVPHYFGPWPNWALSPLTSADATVTISAPDLPGGTTATAVASVGGGVGVTGVVTGITIVDPGSGYTTQPTVTIGGSGNGATAEASITVTSAVTAVNVTAVGGGYASPRVTFSGGGGTTQATGTPYGGVDAINVDLPGDGYTFPTVDIDAPDDPNGTQATAYVEMGGAGDIARVIVDNPGSGYANAPGVVIRDGTIYDPVTHVGVEAIVTATIDVQYVLLDTIGAGYTSAPAVDFIDLTGGGGGATATALVEAGAVNSIKVLTAGSGYVTPGGVRKFVDDLPGLCDPAVPGNCEAAIAANNLGKVIPIGAPIQKKYFDPQGQPIKADVYDIGVVQYRTKFNTDLAGASGNGSLVRGYVQIATDEWKADPLHTGLPTYPLFNELRDGTQVPVMENGVQVEGVTQPFWLGPTLLATKNKPVRISFHNLLPTGVDGNLFIPTDTTLMGSGGGPVVGMPAPIDNGTVDDQVRNPVCTDNPQDPNCYKQNRATLHNHGAISPWISDGTPHQWITPANEDTAWPQGVDVVDVPDMTPRDQPRDGIQTFYYTNQQSARLLFYHDHAWGITRLNVYVGEAAGYLISDSTEATLTAKGLIPGPADTIPLVVQDRTFVPQDTQLYDTTDASGTILTYGQDPTWNKDKWGDYGDLWMHHVYMPAQNPGDPSGMSAYGRWMYGPWFWPPATPPYGPIANPFYDPNCDLNDPATWTYQTDPFCEPQQIPGTPLISTGMEQFNDTAIVNGVAFPKVTLQPKTYRFRVLNAANDRFFNLQWYLADPNNGNLTEVALDPLLLQQAQTDPNVFPTPVGANNSSYGPDWIQIASEGGFLPAPAVVDGQQPITWITDPTRFDVGNVDKHSLVLGPAERADVIVDFSKFAGKTLIMYNDAPAAYPARVPSYDYYTGAPDMAPNGAPTIIPGYGPNTRTVMQVTIANAAPAPTFNLQALRTAFSHKTNGSGVFESGQNPIIVGQAQYNSAYGTSFSTGSNCNAPNATTNICDGLVRVSDTMQFGFNTLRKPKTKTTMPLQPKAIHDEMNATTFDEFGRMQSNLGVEAQPPTPALQNVTLYPYINPPTELIDGTNLPKESVAYDAEGNPVSDVKIQPISDPNDGSQIWRITHNGVDTHPLHFHLYDVQILNRVTWDNIIILTEPSELGWKDTIRVSPLEDTIVALRPCIPQVPWELPNAIRDMNPAMPTGSTAGFNNILPDGTPSAAISNQLVNFGWSYVYHCHILTHEEMDMMRPQSVALPPNKATGLTPTIVSGKVNLSFSDNSINETAFVIEKSVDNTTWNAVGTIVVPLDQPNVHETRTWIDPVAFNPNVIWYYRVVAQNTLGYGAGFPTMTAQSTSAVVPTSQPQITATAGTGGTITPSGVVTVPFGTDQTFNMTPNAGYHVKDVLVDTVSVGAVATYQFVNVTAMHTISVTFERNPGITVTAPPTNTTWLRNTTKTVNWTITQNPTVGYFRVWATPTAGGTTSSVSTTFVNVVPGQATYSLDCKWTLPAGQWNLSVYYYDHDGVFKAQNGNPKPVMNVVNSYLITSTTTTGGTISPLGDTMVASGANQAYTLTPNAGWHVARILVDGIAAGAGTSYTFSNVTANHTIAASFERDPAITITSPLTSTIWIRNTSKVVTWTVTNNPTVGSFRVWAVPTAGGTTRAVSTTVVNVNAAQSTYNLTCTWTLAAGSWNLLVYYYDGTGAFKVQNAIKPVIIAQ